MTRIGGKWKSRGGTLRREEVVAENLVLPVCPFVVFAYPQVTDIQIQNEIYGVWDTFVGGLPPKENFHHRLRDEFVALGARLGFESRCEHRVGRVYARHRWAYIDVIWRDGSGVPRLLLEIDDGSNGRAVRKLLGNPARLRVWFGYGSWKTFSTSLRKHGGTRAKEIVLLVKPSPFG